MLRLRPNQRLALEAFQRQSFQDYCAASHYEPSTQEARLLEAAKESWRQFMAALSETASDPEAAEPIANEYLSASTWQEIKRLQVRDDIQRVGESIALVRLELPIDWDYLRAVAAEGEVVAPELGDPQSIPVFLQQVPHLLVYGAEFNAFVMREKSLADIPSVFIYEHLMAAIDLFLDVMGKQLILAKQNGNFTLPDEELWSSLGASEAFVEALSSAIDMMLLRIDSAYVRESMALSRSSGALLIINRFISLGAGDFVRLHEYGHLLMGHLRSPQRPALEALADRFAMTVLKQQFLDTPGANFWIKLGAVGALVAMRVRDFIEPPPTGTHPPTRARVRALLRDTSHESLMLRMYVRAMLVLSRHTLERVYGITLSKRGA